MFRSKHAKKKQWSPLPAKLWARGRLDIGWRDLLFAFWAPLLPGLSPRLVWPTKQPHLALFSVRTAWDALLCVQDWPPGSEIILSEVNISGMVRLIEEHGLVPVTVPVHPRTLQVRAEDVRAAITDRTRAILLSPLFGARMDLSEISVLAHENELLLVEDSAQAFCGSHYRGDALADVTLFFFGLIKTQTALSGAVAFARDPQLLNAMARQVASYPRITTAQYYRRWLRAVLLQLLSSPLPFALFWRALRGRGLDPDLWLSQVTRGMSGPNLLDSVRRRPHRGTLKLLRRRLQSCDERSPQQRVTRGKHSLNVLPNALGDKAQDSVFWALPVEVPDREAFIETARRAGFDVSFRASSITCHSSPTTPFARALAASVFLSILNPMPDNEWERLLDFVSQNT